MGFYTSFGLSRDVVYGGAVDRRGELAAQALQNRLVLIDPEQAALNERLRQAEAAKAAAEAVVLGLPLEDEGSSVPWVPIALGVGALVVVGIIVKTRRSSVSGYRRRRR